MSAVASMVVAVAAGGLVVVLRMVNEGLEPEGRNWWLAVAIGMALGYLPAGLLLLARPHRRLLGAAFLVVGVTQLVSALSAEWAAAADPQGIGSSVNNSVADLFEAGGLVVLVGGVPWLLPWRDRRRPGDPLGRWLTAGVVASCLGAGFAALAVGGLPGANIAGPLLLLTTVPLLAVGAVVGVMRDDPGHFAVASHRFLVWVLLAAGIAVAYTAVVAGFGALLGSEGPAWLLVAATGGIALAIEPVRGRSRRLVDGVVYGERDDPLTLVRQVMQGVTADVDIDAVLPSLAGTLARAMRLELVSIDVLSPTGWRQLAAHGGPTPHSESFALANGERQVGRLVVGWLDGSGLRSRDRAVLADIVPHVTLTVGLVELTTELRRSSLAVVTSREDERRRLRRDLHDGLGPTLTGIAMGLRTIVRRVGREEVEPATVALLGRLADEVDVASVDVKRIVRDLRPTALDDQSLVVALADFAHALDGVLDVELDLAPAHPALPAAVEVASYRIATEALTNVVRHATATTCCLRVAVMDHVDIVVTDDGVGLQPGQRPGVGLTAMRERVAELGGTLTVTGVVPHGTCVHATLPLVTE